MQANLPTPRFVLRWLRVGLSLMSLTLGVFFTCLWGRQVWMGQHYVGFRTDQQIWLYQRPDDLRIHIEELRKPAASAWRWRIVTLDERSFRGPIFPWEYDKQVVGFAYWYSRGNLALAIPFWFLTLSCAVATRVGDGCSVRAPGRTPIFDGKLALTGALSKSLV